MIWAIKNCLLGAMVSLMTVEITEALSDDLPEILQLQRQAYVSEAELVGSYDIEPLQQTLAGLQQDFAKGNVLKAVTEGKIIASIRAFVEGNTVYVGKLMVQPDWQNKGLGGRLLRAIEDFYPQMRYELFTSSKSVKNIYLYEKIGYKEFQRKQISSDLQMIFLEKQVDFFQAK